ncbi:hypothetical protein GBN32_01875 [Plesiomonas shigelloides]|uniref:hypothetical protein n=1 Tax=Plesiomonas shigelloides TaxID=703 RepID=UPI0012620AD8|nr:hypothetical protein [Plesiomonas shigelloides]KAB7714913.1 hypothetical protein GBN32_01875 [Plesiomonas shigelloides]
MSRYYTDSFISMTQLAHSNKYGSENMFQTELQELVNEISAKVFTFQKTGYSFEEWFNWELYNKLINHGYDAQPKPPMQSDLKSFADILVNKPFDDRDVYIEVKLVHDDTGDKWLGEIEKDHLALKSNTENTSAIGFQILLLTSSHKNLIQHPNWKPWLNRLTFWSVQPDTLVHSNQENGNTVIVGWVIN